MIIDVVQVVGTEGLVEKPVDVIATSEGTVTFTVSQTFKGDGPVESIGTVFNAPPQDLFVPSDGTTITRGPNDEIIMLSPGKELDDSIPITEQEGVVVLDDVSETCETVTDVPYGESEEYTAICVDNYADIQIYVLDTTFTSGEDGIAPEICSTPETVSGSYIVYNVSVPCLCMKPFEEGSGMTSEPTSGTPEPTAPTPTSSYSTPTPTTKGTPTPSGEPTPYDCIKFDDASEP
jgi:hypothetical protein